MPEFPLLAAYRAVRLRLTDMALGTPPWADRAYAGQAPARAALPYVVFSFLSGAQTQLGSHKQAIYVLEVICCAATLEASLEGASHLTARVDNQGTQDSLGGGALDAGPDWAICTATPAETVSRIIMAEGGATPLYVSGSRVRLRMAATVAV